MTADPNWSPADPLTFAPPGSQQMACAVTGVAGSDTFHIVWVTAKTLYHARRVDGSWQPPIKIAGGEQPSLAAAPDGTLYCAFANWFLGTRNIYLSVWSNDKWSLPQVVSRTTGESTDPAVCVGPDGSVHLVWADDTPGVPVIYHGLREPKGWTYGPIPNGRGARPAIAASPTAVYVAWQDRLGASKLGKYEVMAAVKRGADWDLPAVVSDTPEIHSLLPRIAVNTNDRCHMVWQEERGEHYVIRHSDLWPNGWEDPVDVSDPTADARIGASVANKAGAFQFLWSEGAILKHRIRSAEPQGAWSAPEVVCADCAGLGDLAAAISPSGELHVVYNRWPNGAERELFYLKRSALERNKLFVPVALGQ